MNTIADRAALQASVVSMDTVVTIQVPADGSGAQEALQRALAWFPRVERACSRFEPDSELNRACQVAGQPVVVGPIVFQAVRFALDVAAASGGLFDPTVGGALLRHGFNRSYRTGRLLPAPAPAESPTFRDVVLDERAQTITLLRPLTLDLGAVAKGLAIDLAARELDALQAFAIDAGGDVYVRGSNPSGRAWHIGIDHPRREGEMLAVLAVPEGAVCTSGDYLRTGGGGAGDHHLLDARSGTPARAAVSCTVVAERAMLADALSTAAFVAGPATGLRLLAGEGVDGLIVTPGLDWLMTPGFARWLA